MLNRNTIPALALLAGLPVLTAGAAPAGGVMAAPTQVTVTYFANKKVFKDKITGTVADLIAAVKKAHPDLIGSMKILIPDNPVPIDPETSLNGLGDKFECVVSSGDEIQEIWNKILDRSEWVVNEKCIRLTYSRINPYTLKPTNLPEDSATATEAKRAKDRELIGARELIHRLRIAYNLPEYGEDGDWRASLTPANKDKPRQLLVDLCNIVNKFAKDGRIRLSYKIEDPSQPKNKEQWNKENPLAGNRGIVEAEWNQLQSEIAQGRLCNAGQIPEQVRVDEYGLSLGSGSLGTLLCIGRKVIGNLIDITLPRPPVPNRPELMLTISK